MEYDLAIIGAGPGGYVGAIKAAQLGLKVVLIEKDPYLGGTCLNVGCIPSKALLQSSEYYHLAKHQFQDHGISLNGVSLDFSKMQKRKDGVVESFRAGLNGLMKKNRIDVICSEAKFSGTNEILLSTGSAVKFRYAMIATGSNPSSLPFITIDEVDILSSTGALRLSDVPKTMGVIGAGVIGVELGSVYSRLGADVVIIEYLDRIVPTSDRDISKAFQKILETQGIKFHTSSKVTAVEKKDGKIKVIFETDNQKNEVFFEKLLVSVGRVPNTKNLGLEQAQIKIDSKGFIAVNSSLQTSQPNIYAIGDVIGQPMLAHKASDEAVAAVLHMSGKSAHINMISIPNVVYTDPEVASVGISEDEAKDKKLKYKSFIFPMKANSRAKTAMQEDGFVKIIVDELGHLIGAHIIASHAGELIQTLILLIDKKIPIQDVEHLPYAHPTLVEAVKEAILGGIFKPIHI